MIVGEGGTFQIIGCQYFQPSSNYRAYKLLGGGEGHVIARGGGVM